MVQINFASREVSCKIVYYGPGRCGKTTNLQVVHVKAPPTSTGEMVSIATKGDRTLYFDFLSLDLGTVAGMRTRFHLYTVPGQVYYDQTRKLVLQGSDGIVFVADSAREMMKENIESLDNLAKNLHENGLDIADIPLVLQWNKRDLPGAMPLEEMEKALNRHSWPSFEATAVKGDGVFQTLKGIAQQVIRKLNREQGYSDDGQSRKGEPKSFSVSAPHPPPPPPPAAGARRPLMGSSARPASSAPPPVSAPQAPRSPIAPPSVPKSAPSGGPPAAPAARRPPTIQPRSAPPPKAPAQPRAAPPPPGAPGAEARTPTHEPAVPALAAQAPKSAPPPPKAAQAPASGPKPPAPAAAPKPAVPAQAPKPHPTVVPAKAAAPAAPPPPVVQPSPTATPVPAPAPKPGSTPAPPRSVLKTFKVKRYPPDPEDMEEGEVVAAPSATPVPSTPAPTPAAPSAPSAPKSSGSLKSILLLIGLLALAGAAIAVYQFLLKK
jgi:hypothetical protein